MEQVEKVEKGLSLFKKIGNWYYGARIRKDRIDKLIDQYEELEAEKKDLQQQDVDLIKQMVDITATVQEIESKLSCLGSIDKNIEMVKKGLQKSLLFSLRGIHFELVYQRKWATAQEKKEFCETYKAYHALGENGVADKYFKEVMDLPERQPEVE